MQTLSIKDGIISYPEGVDSATASWDASSATLTLNNYNGAPLCFYLTDANKKINVILSGVNTIDMDHFINDFPAIQLGGQGSLSIGGSGDLNIINGHYITIVVDGGYVVLKSGTVNVASALGQSCSIQMGVFIIEGGSFTTSCYVENQFFVQNGGDFSIDNAGDEAYRGCLVLEMGGYIDSGTLNITCESTSDEQGEAILVSPGDSISSWLLRRRQFVRQEGNIAWLDIGNAITEGDNHYEIPVSQEYNFYIAGGDITLTGSIGIHVEVEGSYDDFGVENAEELKNWAKSFVIGFDEDVIVEPDTIEVSLMSENERDYGGYFEAGYWLAFTDVQDNDTPLDHFHIYKVNALLPSADGDEEGNTEETEENPNTIDFRLFSIISAILVSIVAEAFIIMDLRRRVVILQNQMEKESDDATNHTE